MARYTKHIAQRPCPLRTGQATHSGLSIQLSLDGNNFSYSHSYSEDILVLFPSNGLQIKPPQVSATNWIPPWKMKYRAVEGGSHQAKLKIERSFEFGPAITNLRTKNINHTNGINARNTFQRRGKHERRQSTTNNQIKTQALSRQSTSWLLIST